MRDIEHERAFEDLRTRASEIAAGSPSIESFYSLEPLLTYFDLWYEIVNVFRRQWEIAMAREQWTQALRSQLSDPVPWFPAHYRSGAFTENLQHERLNWSARPHDRCFEAHHDVASHVVDIAAAHLTLLLESDPVGTVEYIAALPNRHMLWRAVGWLNLGTRDDLVDSVIASSASTGAVVLCLASQLDQLCDVARGHELIPSNVESRLLVLITSTLRRDDAGAIAGPWLRHLIRLADKEATDAPRHFSAVATLGLDMSISAIPHTIVIDRFNQPDVACLVARMKIDHSHTSATAYWDEWVSLMKAQDVSRFHCGETSFRAVGDTLASAANPLSLWIAAACAMESLFRARARVAEYESEQVIAMLIFPAIHATARMRSDGRELWLAAYTLARRRFLIELPYANRSDFRLSSLLFASFYRVFGDDSGMREALLDLLPTQQHVVLARELLNANPPESP